MVTIVSEHWRDKLSAGSSGRRLLLLPDCPMAVRPAEQSDASRPPHLCGPGCVIGTLWGAAREQGWVVETTPRAVAGLGGLLTGPYDGIRGGARHEAAHPPPHGFAPAALVVAAEASEHLVVCEGLVSV
jgi:hypothetical protein